MNAEERARALDLIEEFFPIQPELDEDLTGGVFASLELVRADEPDAAWVGSSPAQLKLTLRLIVWELGQQPGMRQIRDIKEQDVIFAREDVLEDHARLRAYLTAWSDALAVCFSPHRVAQVELLMPMDLVFKDALTLRKAHAVEDFRQALAAKSRLGRYGFTG